VLDEYVKPNIRNR